MSEIARDSDRQALLASVLRVFPRSIRATLTSDDAFARQLGLEREPIVSIGNTGIALEQARLASAIRDLLGDNSLNPKVLDTTNHEWTLHVDVIDGQKQVSMRRGEQVFQIPTPLAISSNRAERMEWFDRAMRSVYFSEASVSEWRERISKNPLTDKQLAQLQNDLKIDPEEVLKQILAHLANGEVGWEILVPVEREYYENLVGKWTEGNDLAAYAKDEGAKHIHDLVVRDQFDGFLKSLLLASHPYLVDAIRPADLTAVKLVQAFDWLVKHGDIVSCVGAVEFGLSAISQFPEISPQIEGLSRRLCVDTGESPDSRWKLLKLLIAVVDGELARRATLEAAPPFWRRLAAIAHASLIERALLASSGDAIEFATSAAEQREFYFTMRTFVDLRLEPRWLPDYVATDQLRQDLLGRIMGAAEKAKGSITLTSLREQLYGENDNSIANTVKFPYAYFPGPLEGAVRSHAELPEELANEIRASLGSDEVQANSFTTLINASLVFRLPDDLIALAVDAIRRSKYRLANLTDKQSAFSVLHSLATTSASARSPSLANEIRILTRVRFHEDRSSLRGQEIIRIALISAAAHSDLSDWCKFLGEWLTEIAYETWQDRELIHLQRILRQLFVFVPELWVTAAPADAAMSGALTLQVG